MFKSLNFVEKQKKLWALKIRGKGLPLGKNSNQNTRHLQLEINLT
jgi:hypothetical protein